MTATGAPGRSRLSLTVYAVAAAVLVVDQATKLWATSALAGEPPVQLLGDLLQLRLIYNSGAAFSMGAGHTWIFTVVAAAAVVAIAWVARRVGSAIVVDPDSAGVGIITERDVLYAIGAGLDPDVERAADHQTAEVVYARPDWTVTEAATAMVRGGFRHLVVLDGDDVLGVISVRDILRVWSEQRVTA